MMNSSRVGRAGPTADSDESADRPKAVLFCPACDHESRVDGDWVISDDTEAGTRTLHCPECSQRVTDRPLPETDRQPLDRPTTGLFAGGLRTAGDFWTGMVRAWLDWGRRADC